MDLNVELYGKLCMKSMNYSNSVANKSAIMHQTNREPNAKSNAEHRRLALLPWRASRSSEMNLCYLLLHSFVYCFFRGSFICLFVLIFSLRLMGDDRRLEEEEEEGRNQFCNFTWKTNRPRNVRWLLFVLRICERANAHTHARAYILLALVL